MSTINVTNASFDTTTNGRLLYLLTESDSCESMSHCIDNAFEVADFAEYDTTNHKGEPVHLLSILDKEGIVRTTQSKTFIERFMKIRDMLGFEGTTIKIKGGTTKSGKQFITCTIL